MSTETNRYGEPIEQVTLEEVLKDLAKMPADLVYAVCAVLIIEHRSFTWATDKYLLKEALSEEE